VTVTFPMRRFEKSGLVGARLRQGYGGQFFALRATNWWSRSGSNRRPLECHSVIDLKPSGRIPMNTGASVTISQGRFGFCSSISALVFGQFSDNGSIGLYSFPSSHI